MISRNEIFHANESQQYDNESTVEYARNGEKCTCRHIVFVCSLNLLGSVQSSTLYNAAAHRKHKLRYFTTNNFITKFWMFLEFQPGYQKNKIK